MIPLGRMTALSTRLVVMFESELQSQDVGQFLDHAENKPKMWLLYMEKEEISLSGLVIGKLALW